MSLVVAAAARDVTLAWDASPSADVVRYKIFGLGSSDVASKFPRISPMMTV